MRTHIEPGRPFHFDYGCLAGSQGTSFTMQLDSMITDYRAKDFFAPPYVKLMRGNRESAFNHLSINSLSIV